MTYANFMRKIKTVDPELFMSSQGSLYSKYGTKCQWTDRRQPGLHNKKR